MMLLEDLVHVAQCLKADRTLKMKLGKNHNRKRGRPITVLHTVAIFTVMKIMKIFFKKGIVVEFRVISMYFDTKQVTNQ